MVNRQFYDGYFYEARAISQLAKISPVRLGVRLREFSKPYREWCEVDGIQLVDGKEYVIEVKSYPLRVVKIEEIVRRYRKYGFKRFKLVAPAFEKSVERVYECDVECISFEPNLNPIRAYYEKLRPQLPPHLQAEFETGLHHFRYKLSYRARTKPVRFINQTDKRIRDFDDLRKEILYRMPPWNPPVRVYWSTSRWLFPKQLYFSRDSNYLMGGPLVLDVDGPKIHSHKFPCYVDGSGLCAYCVISAKHHTMRMCEFLESTYGYSDIEIVFSGRQGFHLYVHDWPTKNSLSAERRQRLDLLKKIKELKIETDELVTLDIKHVVTFPMSLHAYTMRPVLPVPNIGKLNVQELKQVTE